jgi:hypothetical protein
MSRRSVMDDREETSTEFSSSINRRSGLFFGKPSIHRYHNSIVPDNVAARRVPLSSKFVVLLRWMTLA